ncbi:unnamed protein product [Callosobruchus maculatus]|uniref:Uncharacterized protein n=1 Tax=Callosobruchus maculatus TaxID=64391 RepID=A0A653D848_CALMS|nr:unnamed protein product [Callosobruchus maculatus]
MCPIELKPEIKIQTCNEHPCPPRWNYSEHPNERSKLHPRGGSRRWECADSTEQHVSPTTAPRQAVLQRVGLSGQMEGAGVVQVLQKLWWRSENSEAQTRRDETLQH